MYLKDNDRRNHVRMYKASSEKLAGANREESNSSGYAIFGTTPSLDTGTTQRREVARKSTKKEIIILTLIKSKYKPLSSL